MKQSKRKKKNNKMVVLLTILLISLLGILVLRNAMMQALYPKKYKDIVEKYANEYQVDSNLIYAIIKAESNFNEKAQSNKGAKGLMQLMEKTAKDMVKKVDGEILPDEIGNYLLNPEINIQLGTKYMATLLARYQCVEIALTAYNAGIGTVDTWIEKGEISADGSDIEKIPYQETNQYVRKILRDYQIYQNKK